RRSKQPSGDEDGREREQDVQQRVWRGGCGRTGRPGRQDGWRCDERLSVTADEQNDRDAREQHGRIRGDGGQSDRRARPRVDVHVVILRGPPTGSARSGKERVKNTTFTAATA